MLSTTRLYGSVIAIVSGVYSLWLATAWGGGMTASAWFMLAVGVVVVLHGIVLLTPLAESLGTASGPLMIVYAVVMLLNQGWMASGMGTRTDGSMDGTNGGMNGGMGGEIGGGMVDGAVMGADVGMVAIAVIMLASGIIMTVRSDDGGAM